MYRFKVKAPKAQLKEFGGKGWCLLNKKMILLQSIVLVALGALLSSTALILWGLLPILSLAMFMVNGGLYWGTALHSSQHLISSCCCIKQDMKPFDVNSTG